MGKIKDIPAGARAAGDVGTQLRMQVSPFSEPAPGPVAQTASPARRDR
jgi:hypothetical protein